jgi:hypothetical protein
VAVARAEFIQGWASNRQCYMPPSLESLGQHPRFAPLADAKGNTEAFLDNPTVGSMG